VRTLTVVICQRGCQRVEIISGRVALLQITRRTQRTLIRKWSRLQQPLHKRLDEVYQEQEQAQYQVMNCMYSGVAGYNSYQHTYIYPERMLAISVLGEQWLYSNTNKNFRGAMLHCHMCSVQC